MCKLIANRIASAVSTTNVVCSSSLLRDIDTNDRQQKLAWWLPTAQLARRETMGTK